MVLQQQRPQIEVDLESQTAINNGGPSSPLSPSRSPLSRLSWSRKPSVDDRTGRSSRRWSRDATAVRSPSARRQGTAESATSPLSSPLVPTSATLFNTQDRPDLQMMESYAVASPRASMTTHSLDRSNSFSKGIGRLKSPSMRISRSRSRQRGSGSLKKPHTEISSPMEADQTALRIDTQGFVPSEVRRPSPIDGEVPPPAATAADTLPDPQKQRLADLHAQHPHLRALPNPLLPIVPFPGQGTGRLSEFAQDAPLWSRQPYKILYFAYFGLSVGLVFLPWFAFLSLFPSKRQRPSWTWKKSTLVLLYRHGTRLTFRTHTSLSRDLSKEVPHSQTVRAKFVWVEGLPDNLVRGELKRGLEVQGLTCVRTCGFWYGERDGGGGVGQKAAPKEKVVYHLHGGAYWIGTAHEKDVTSAVNVQVLKAMNAIYTNRMPSKDETTPDGRQSPHPSNGAPTAGDSGLCKRAFSLDYRLCVPGRPEIGSFPAPLADALAGYRYLVQECEFEPQNIIIAGDSAGGNLALAVCRYLRDESLAEMPMPGALLLLSPWVDASRSHSGPLSAPNKLSAAYRNRSCDIIANSAAFRNTAVSALLGNMPARETYKNPYLSSVSLQLAAKDGGVGPRWGFEGFPRRIYICTGTAEISHDQHLTLAYRLASGSKSRVPIHAGDKCSEDADPYEMAARLQYPRPEDHEVTLWPSAQNTPSGMPLSTPLDGWEELRATNSNSNANNNGSSNDSKGEGYFSAQQQRQPQQHNQPDADIDWEAEKKEGKTKKGITKGLAEAALDTATSAVDAVSVRIRNADGYILNVPSNVIRRVLTASTSSSSSSSEYEGEAGTSPKTTAAVKEKDMAADGNATHDENARMREKERRTKDKETPLVGKTIVEEPESMDTPVPVVRIESEAIEHDEKRAEKRPKAQVAKSSYFDVGGEDRKVVLDECIDGIHDYTLFDWFEPERGHTWARIARWIDEEV